MAEGARLESVYRGNSIEGSNPSLSASSSAYAHANRVHPVGVVILDETGARTDILIEKAITPDYHAAAKQLLRVHVSFWLAGAREINGAKGC